MSQTLRLATWLSTFLMTACVTINIYFPAAAAEDAADQIIEDIQGNASIEEPVSYFQHLQQYVAVSAQGVLNIIVPAAHAADADISIDSAEIRHLRTSMKSRFDQMKVYLDQGFVGIANDGYLKQKDGVSIPLSERNPVKKIIEAENADRKALYQAIATANGHPEWAGNIQDTFAHSWVKNAFSGWWYQTTGGDWKQK